MHAAVLTGVTPETLAGPDSFARLPRGQYRSRRRPQRLENAGVPPRSLRRVTIAASESFLVRRGYVVTSIRCDSMRGTQWWGRIRREVRRQRASAGQPPSLVLVRLTSGPVDPTGPTRQRLLLGF